MLMSIFISKRPDSSLLLYCRVVEVLRLIIYKDKSLSNRSRFVKQANRQHTERGDYGDYVESCSFIHKVILQK